MRNWLGVDLQRMVINTKRTAEAAPMLSVLAIYCAVGWMFDSKIRYLEKRDSEMEEGCSLEVENDSFGVNPSVGLLVSTGHSTRPIEHG